MQSLVAILGSGLDGSIDTAFGTMLAEALLVVGLLLLVVLVYCASRLQLEHDRQVAQDKYGNGYGYDEIVESWASDIPTLVVPVPLGSAVDGVPLLSPLLLVDRIARRHNRDGVRRLTVREAIAGVPDEYADTAIDERPTQVTQALTPALIFPAHPTVPETDQPKPESEPEPKQEQPEQPEQPDQEWAPSVIVGPYGHLIEMRMRPLSRENLN